MKRWKVIGVALVGVGALWYFLLPDNAPNLGPVTDSQVETWLDGFEHTDAIEFLEEGGKYADKDYAGQKLDHTIVLPLLHRVREETGQEAVAILFKENRRFAGAMSIALPSDPAKLRRLHSIFEEADENFSGVILRQFGLRFMHFQVMDAEFARASEMENWNID